MKSNAAFGPPQMTDAQSLRHLQCLRTSADESMIEVECPKSFDNAGFSPGLAMLTRFSPYLAASMMQMFG